MLKIAILSPHLIRFLPLLVFTSFIFAFPKTGLVFALIWFSWRIFYFERELERKIKENEVLRQRGSEFIANISHELKTPLTSIKGYTETLKTVVEKDPQKAQEFLARIEDNAERLGLLINDIL